MTTTLAIIGFLFIMVALYYFYDQIQETVNNGKSIAPNETKGFK